MYIHLALHHPKGPEQKSHFMHLMPEWAEIQRAHKGFIKLIVGEVEDENIITLTGIWESEEDFRSAFGDMRKFLAAIDFPSIQDGPTRSGTSKVSEESPLATVKISPVLPPKSTTA
jgi:quinol monooxygenase YgiN